MAGFDIARYIDSINYNIRPEALCYFFLNRFGLFF